VVAASAWVVSGSLALVLYAYVGYALLCWLRARLSPSPIARRPIAPRVSIVVAAWRERATIGHKLASLALQYYPAALTEVLVVCDGSDDGTAEEARTVGGRLLPGRLQVLELPERRGKPAALNAAVLRARGEILVVTDARQRLSPDAVGALVADLGDPVVGAVGGRLVLEDDAPIGAYWSYETQIRRWEGEHGSTVGVSGALYAIRRELFQPIPEETILDDVLVPARVRLGGRRVAYQPLAIAFDRAAPSGREFRRKVRTLAGNFQLLLLEPSLFLPWRNPAWFDFVSHKLTRLAVPFLLPIALGASAMVGRPWSVILVALQLSPYPLVALRGLGKLSRSRIAGLCETFVLLNAAAVVALFRFLRHGRRLPW
jgi:cellulose synthase/poly-beta-1,6-N-acetylglucosamine synthase-like glycosyltransferase